MSLYIMTTIVDGNSAVVRNIHSETGAVDKNNLDIIYDYYRLQILFNNIIFQLKPPMLLYSGADFENFLVSIAIGSTIIFVLTVNHTANMEPFKVAH